MSKEEEIYKRLVGTHKDCDGLKQTGTQIAKTLGVTHQYIYKIIKQFLNEGLIVKQGKKTCPMFYSATTKSYEGKKRRIETLKKYDWTENQKKIIYGELLGDGYLNKNQRYIVLSTDGFLRDDVDYLVNQLIENGFNAKRRVTSRNKSEIFIKKADEFLKWIGEPKIKDYAYKWEVTS